MNFWLLSVALLLLWCPRQWLRSGGKMIPWPRSQPASRSEREPQDISLGFKEEFAKPRNWVDFIRALAGALAATSCFGPIPGEAAESADVQIRILQGAVLVIAVVIQTVRFNDDRITLVAPVFFILGLSFGLLTWEVALFACVAIWIINTVLPGAGFFLFVFAGLEVCFGLLLSRSSSDRVFLAVLLTALPLVLSTMFNRALVRLTRKKKSHRWVKSS